jgi:hypothetical protein
MPSETVQTPTRATGAYPFIEEENEYFNTRRLISRLPLVAIAGELVCDGLLT